MICFRPLQEQDFPALLRLSKNSGTGVTSFPKDKRTLMKRLRLACQSFHTPSHCAYYWFILEHAHTGQPIGVSAIETHVGITEPFYSYQLTEIEQSCASLHLKQSHRLLTLSTSLLNSSELCTLFIDPTFRKTGLGHLLSRARFLFIAQFPHHFSTRLIAELRGFVGINGIPPFWHAVGQHFFPFTFKKADSLTLQTKKQFIADLMPQHPLYVELLPRAVQRVIGQPHRLSRPAMHILMKEGFQFNQHVDVFDAGPTLEAATFQLPIIKQSMIKPIVITQDEPHGPCTMLSNTQFQTFRATYAPIQVKATTITVSKATATQLNIGPDELVRISLPTTLQE